MTDFDLSTQDLAPDSGAFPDDNDQDFLLEKCGLSDAVPASGASGMGKPGRAVKPDKAGHDQTKPDISEKSGFGSGNGMGNGSGSVTRFLEIGAFLQRPPSTSWLIRNFICTDITLVFIGEPSSGKSLIVIDMACHIATGRDWCGNAVKPGLVLYVCGEGQHGLSKRFMAWFQRYGERPRNIHLATIPAALTDASDITAFIQDVTNNLPEKPVVVFLDTLNRNFGPGDENSTADMTKAVNGLDRIRGATQAAMGVIHHCGKGDKFNSRGSSVLKGAADVEFLVEKNPETNIVTMRHAKPPKDFDPPPAVAWVITKQTTPWADEDGQPIDSVVLEPIDLPPDREKGPGLGDNQRKGLDILKRLFNEFAENLKAGGLEGTPKVSIRDWNAAMKAAGFPRNRCSDVRASLLERKLITVEGDCYVFPV